MTIINTGENQIKWTVRKGLSSVNEDFTRSDVMLFAISQTNKIPLPITSKEKGVIVAKIPNVVPATQDNPEYGHIGIQEDTYDVELVWIKNKRELNRTYLHNAFRVSDNPLIQTLTVEIVSTAQSYGYDGLSAYEIAMFRRLSEGESAICENQWLEDLLAEKANTTDLNALRYRVDDIEDVLSDFEEDIANLEDGVSNLDDSKADKNDVYTKQHVDDNFATKTSVYTKSEVDSYLASKADKTALDSKADKADTYTKEQIDNQMTLKANVSYVDGNFATKLVLNQEAFERGQKDDLLDNRIDGVSTRVGAVERLIPLEADPDDNLLADKEFVNSSISTNTATFRGSYNIVTDLGLSTIDVDNQRDIAPALLVATSSCENNDYCFAAIPVSNEMPTTIKEVRRFKYSETNNGWVYEYTLNNSGFTAAQWAAINSNITSNLTAKLSSLPTSENLESVLNSKANINDVYTINQADVTFIKQSEKIDYISREIVDNSRVPTNLAVRLTNEALVRALNSKQNTITSTNKISADLVNDNESEHKFVTAGQKTLWNTVTEKAPLPFVITCGIDPSDVPFVNNTLDEIWTAYQNGKNIRVNFSKAGGVSFEDDATLLLDGSRNCVAHTVHNGTHYTITIYEDNNVTKLSYAETHDSDKQDVISDLSTIRSGATSGATAYQKPQSGIPANDIASGVIPDISNLANKSGSLSQDFAAKSLSVLGRGTSNGIKLYRSDGQIPYGRIIMESDLVSSGIDYMLPTTGVAEQSAVVLATKASVDAKYTKPSSGIPASDIAAGVIPDVSNFITNSVLTTALAAKQDTLVSGTNIKTINNQSILGSGNLDVKDVFIVEYEVTTYQDVVNAYNAGKYLILKYSLPSMSEDYRLLLLEDVTLSIDGVTQGTYSFTFSAISGARSYSVYLTTNGYEPDITYVLQQELTFDNAPTANSYNPVISSGIKTALDNKQDKLVSGTNIKTINNTSVLGSGNLTLENSSNKTNDIANNDTDTTKYPSCKGVADYVSDIVGNINSILETI